MVFFADGKGYYRTIIVPVADGGLCDWQLGFSPHRDGDHLDRSELRSVTTYAHDGVV